MIKYRRRFLDDQEKQRRWIDPRLYAVRVEDLEAYLTGKGWTEVSPDRPGFRVFQEPGTTESTALYQFVPESDQWDGYAAQVYELLAALAMIEDRYAGDVLTDVLHARETETNGAPATRATETSKN
jgi:hypothetical protein